MNNRVSDTLPRRLVEYLRPGAPVLMLTTGSDGYPGAAYTWVVAMGQTRMRLGVDVGGSSLDNLRRNGLLSIQVIGPGDMSFLVKGKARPIKDRIEAAAPVAVMLWEMDVVNARDQSWPGVMVTALAYEWPATTREAMLGMERAVYSEMRTHAEGLPVGAHDPIDLRMDSE